MPREIETLSGDPYQPGLSASRWTSTSGRWDVRAPFASRSGRGLGCGCAGLRGAAGGCGCQKGLDGLGSVFPQIVRNAPDSADRLLRLELFVTSAGRLDPKILSEATRDVFRKNLYGNPKKLTATSYPLTWVWRYDAPNKVYQAHVTGEASGPFVEALDGIGPLVAGTPTAADSQKLPSVGTVVRFEESAVPKGANPNALLSDLRAAYSKLRAVTNITPPIQTRLTLNPAKSRWGLGLVLAAAGALLLMRKKDQDLIEQGLYP